MEWIDRAPGSKNLLPGGIGRRWHTNDDVCTTVKTQDAEGRHGLVNKDLLSMKSRIKNTKRETGVES